MPSPPPLPRIALAGAGAATALGLGALGWSLLEAKAYTVRQVRVPVLPPTAPEIRVLHLSDLHLLPRQRHTIAWLRALGELEPDLVINTGDNMAHRRAMPTVLHALEPLLERPGAFVMGSNDYYAPQMKNPARYLLRDARRTDAEGPPPEDLPGRELGRAFAAAGWRDLTNRRDTLSVRGVPFALVGVDDPHLDRDRFPAADGGASGGDAVVRLGVAHAPYQRVLNAMHADGCGMIFAGHTHGGQLCVPGYGALVTNCDLDTGRASGLSEWPGAAGEPGSAWLHVSNGIGTSPFTPVRLACRPSVTLLTLTRRTDPNA
ncbi:metallophosphoesterase [Ruania alba]|uniref:Predicted phosphohydrolase, MPP superfamily n=1 Tax=Ruania alba TaxID=648782 RepID=A0A1H5MNG6_9MICO|nr:metallophosphoesterase [Ruania alba]SEE90856.1 Predicted phosphohydrolase, MPP superfamily [Ruania alba]